jgi:hypothetical protein
MSRSALIVTVIVTTALIVLCAVGVVPRLQLSPAAQAANVFVEVTPTTVDAGFLVGIRASCGGGSDPATVESGAFGKVTVHPQNGFLTAAATVPIGQRAGYYTVRRPQRRRTDLAERGAHDAISQPGTGHRVWRHGRRAFGDVAGNRRSRRPGGEPVPGAGDGAPASHRWLIIGPRGDRGANDRSLLIGPDATGPDAR